MNLFRKIHALFSKRKLDAEMSEEMRLHVERRAEENIAGGMLPEEARDAALRRFGGVEQAKEVARAQRGGSWFDELAQDLRYAVRTLAKAPGFAAVVVLTLALGIGANTAIFSVVRGVLLKPLAYREPERLVTLLHQGRFPVAPADFLDWRAQSQVFEGIAAAEMWGATLRVADRTESIPGIRLGEGWFEVLGVRPLLGRTFHAADFIAGGERVVVLSHGAWQRRFGGDAGVVGKSLLLGGEPFTVVGVMPPEFQFAPFWAARAEMAAPLDLTGRAAMRSGNSLRVFARLKAGVQRGQAQAEMDAICRRLEQAYPQTNAGRTVRVDRLLDKTVGDVRGSLRLLGGAVIFVLAIACANVANLLLARSHARRKEMAVRTALGASRSRTIRQLLAESAVLAGAGAALGLPLGYAAVGAMRAWLASEIVAQRLRMPRVADIAVDATALWFTLGLATVTAFVFGLAPALQTARLAQQDALREGGRGATDGPQGQRLRGLLVIAEIALSLIMLIGAGLMLRSFGRLAAINPGFEPRGVLSMSVSLHGLPERVGEKREAFYRELLERVGALPGVSGASAVNHLPLAGDLWTSGLRIEGRPPAKPGEGIVAVERVSWPGYFRTMGVALERGRDFGPQDTPGAPGVVIINEQFARKHWPGENPVGRRIAFDEGGENPIWLTIVGVAKNVRQESWTREAREEVYLPFAQSPFLAEAAGHFSVMTLVVRTAVDPQMLAGPVRDAIGSLEQNASIANVATLEQVVAGALWQPRFNLRLTAIFAGVALALAALGLYGVIAYAVGQRTREIGVRLALGAGGRDVLLLTLAQGVRLVGAGLVLGLAGALGLTRVMAGLLYELTPTDPPTFITGSLLLMTVALLACWLPARRAARVDPMVALRAE